MGVSNRVYKLIYLHRCCLVPITNVTVRTLNVPKLYKCPYTAESTRASMERTKMPNLRNGNKEGFKPGLTHFIASPAFYHSRATALFRSLVVDILQELCCRPTMY